MYRIRRFGIMKTATVAAIMYVIVVAIFFVPATLILGIAGSSTGSANVGAGVGALIVAGIIAALVYGIVGFIFTAVACAVYNLAAGWVGGIEVQVEGMTPPSAPPAWGPITPGAPTLPPGSYGAPPSQGPPTNTAAQVPWSTPTSPTASTTDTPPYDPGSTPRND